MLWLVFASVVTPVYAVLRVGFLSDDSEDKAILNDCIGNSSIELVTILIQISVLAERTLIKRCILSVVTLPACHNYNGLENVARLHYDHQVNVLLGSPCNEGWFYY